MDETHAMNMKPFTLRATQNVRGGGGKGVYQIERKQSQNKNNK